MTTAAFGPFRPPVRLTDSEWAAVESLRSGGSIADAAARLGMAEKRFRLVVANAAEKLRLTASL